jgi:putative tryptophan/tyrosine transport system substrate-binding protein
MCPAFRSHLSGVAWPLAARAQQPMPVIGWLSSLSPEGGKPNLAAFRKALADAGYVEGQNVQIEYRWANGNYDQLPAMAADLVGRRVALIVTSGGEPAAFAAKGATAIPTVMVMGGDPVKEGLVVSLNRPGANVTGATVYAYNMESKRLGLLHEAVPAAKTIAILVNPASPAAESQTREVQEAAPRLGVEVVIFNAHGADEFESLFAAMTERKARVAGHGRSVPLQRTWATNRAGGTKPAAGDLRMASARCRGRLNELWDGADGRL